jgi:hypothetical protein
MILRKALSPLRLLTFSASLLLLALFAWTALSPGIVEADALPPGQKCPDAAPATPQYTEGTGCTYTGSPDPANGIKPLCVAPYTQFGAGFTCFADPVSDTPPPAPNPNPPAPNPPPQPVTCNARLDRPIADPQVGIGLCGHAGFNCVAPYTERLGFCVTDPDNSVLGPDDGGIFGSGSGRLPEPKCAVGSIGRIVCPPNVGNGTDNCYYREAYSGSAWRKVGCSSQEIKLATAQSPLCADDNKTGCDAAHACNAAGNCDLTKKYITPAIQAIGILIGLAIVASIVWAGIEYSKSSDSPQEVTVAKQRILTSILVFIGYLLFGAFLNWIIPGGLGL